MRTLRRLLLLGALAALAGLLPALNASASTQRTAGGAPVTMAATSITTTSAVLNGRYGFTGNTFAHFQYGLTTMYGSHVVAAGPVTPNTVDSVLVTGLTPNTTYNFRYVQGAATPGFGNPGPNLTFTTLSDGSTTAAPRDESADLAIAKSQSAETVTAGGSVTFTLTITHRAGARAFDVGLTDRMPAGLAVTSVTTTKGSCTTEVLCTIGEMGTGETVTVRITATANVVGTIVNTATVGASNPDPNVALNNSARVVLNVRPQVSARTLSLTSTTRVAGGGSATDAGREYAAAIRGALTSAQAACVADVTLVVSQGATADTLVQIGTVTTNATGAIDGRTFIPGTGRFFQVSVAATEGATVSCTAASARFEIAPPSITRSITAEAERGTSFNTIDTVTISGRLTASSPFCSRFITVSWEMLNPPRNFQRPTEVPRTKADGTFSFQLTNPPRLSQSPDNKMETSGIEIKAMRVTWPPLPYPNAGSRALCSTGGSLLQTAQGDLLPQTDATPLNTYSASLIETKVGTSTSFPGPLSSFLPVPVSSFFHSLQVPCLLKSPHAAPCKVP